jgi:hypothetical protein
MEFIWPGIGSIFIKALKSLINEQGKDDIYFINVMDSVYASTHHRSIKIARQILAEKTDKTEEEIMNMFKNRMYWDSNKVHPFLARIHMGKSVKEAYITTVAEFKGHYLNLPLKRYGFGGVEEITQVPEKINQIHINWAKKELKNFQDAEASVSSEEETPAKRQRTE